MSNPQEVQYGKQPPAEKPDVQFGKQPVAEVTVNASPGDGAHTPPAMIPADAADTVQDAAQAPLTDETAGGAYTPADNGDGGIEPETPATDPPAEPAVVPEPETTESDADVSQDDDAADDDAETV